LDWRRHIRRSENQLPNASDKVLPSNVEMAMVLYPMARLAVEVPEFRRQLADRELIACCDFVNAVHDMVEQGEGSDGLTANRELLEQMNCMKERIGDIVAKPSFPVFQREIERARRRASNDARRPGRAPGA